MSDTSSPTRASQRTIPAGPRRAALVFVLAGTASCAGTQTVNGVENVREVTAQREFQHPIDEVWATFFEGFDQGYKFNPNWVDSGWINGAERAEVGAERFMQGDTKGKRVFFERITYFSPEEKKLRFEIYDVKGVPLDTSAAFGESQLIALDENRTLFKITFFYRTSPAFFAGFAQGGLEKDFHEMTVAMEHYIDTHEEVTRENYREIARRYDE